MTDLPLPRGKLTPNKSLADLTWLRVGGLADWLFQPADVEDLAEFLSALPNEIDVFPMGVGSNLIVRDGGLRAVVVRMGRGFNHIEISGDTVTAGVAALDAHVARKAAEAGVDLDAITDQLLDDGIVVFADAFQALLAAVDSARLEHG